MTAWIRAAKSRTRLPSRAVQFDPAKGTTTSVVLPLSEESVRLRGQTSTRALHNRTVHGCATKMRKTCPPS